MVCLGQYFIWRIVMENIQGAATPVSLNGLDLSRRTDTFHAKKPRVKDIKKNLASLRLLRLGVRIYNAIKAPHRYAVQGSDTTMIPIAASLFGQKNFTFLYFII